MQVVVITGLAEGIGREVAKLIAASGHAVAGFDLPGHCRIEPEMIVQIDPELALRIVRERGPHI